jgi:hypothetical protein
MISLVCQGDFMVELTKAGVEAANRAQSQALGAFLIQQNVAQQSSYANRGYKAINNPVTSKSSVSATSSPVSVASPSPAAYNLSNFGNANWVQGYKLDEEGNKIYLTEKIPLTSSDVATDYVQGSFDTLFSQSDKDFIREQERFNKSEREATQQHEKDMVDVNLDASMTIMEKQSDIDESTYNRNLSFAQKQHEWNVSEREDVQAHEIQLANLSLQAESIKALGSGGGSYYSMPLYSGIPAYDVYGGAPYSYGNYGTVASYSGYGQLNGFEDYQRVF